MMKSTITQVSPRQVQADAEQYYRNGFFCCEALMAAVLDHFLPEADRSLIAMASGMAVGAGRSGCLCGAVNGGILALGMFFGRSSPAGPGDPVVNRCMALTHELHDWFRQANGKNAVCCRVLTREFNMAQGEHKAQCIRFTGLCAWKTAEILCRELGIRNLDAPAPLMDSPQA